MHIGQFATELFFQGKSSFH